MLSSANHGSTLSAGNSSGLSGYHRIRWSDFQFPFRVLLHISVAGHRILDSIFKAHTTGRVMVYPYLVELLEQNGFTRATTEASYHGDT
jgi:hypothetical protein